jgi:hypothetical protein
MAALLSSLLHLLLSRHGRARAAFLFSPGGQSSQQAKTAREVKTLSAVISGVDNLWSSANGDGRTLEVRALKPQFGGVETGILFGRD